MTPDRIFTVGHSTRSLEAFLEILQAHGVKRLIDVRSSPRSRHNPQFNAEVLPRSLSQAGIEYTLSPLLGGLRHTRKDSPNSGWRNASFRGYADYMQTAEFEAGLAQLLRVGATEQGVLMCAEAVPWRCHRWLIADALQVRGIAVEHILSKTRRQAHALTHFAKVQGTQLTYPTEDHAESPQAGKPG